ncbi:hypothetical protein J2S54_006903 [Streptomyces sp. DSM 42143]|nr:hypothetical protein [Streptomyces sp. DSM 42143]
MNQGIGHSFGWAAGQTTAAFSLALIVSALAGIRVGRILDRCAARAPP